jgi:hypothetical protein
MEALKASLGVGGAGAAASQVERKPAKASPRKAESKAAPSKKKSAK